MWMDKLMNAHAHAHTLRSVANIHWLVSYEYLTIMTQMKHWSCKIVFSKSMEKGFQICSISIHEQSTVPQLCLMVLLNNCSCSAMWRNPTEFICLLIESFREIHLTPKFLGIKLRKARKRFIFTGTERVFQRYLNTGAHNNAVSQETGEKEAENERGGASATEWERERHRKA